MRELRELVEQLQADKALLQAKLKEAFEIQPAAVDPRELAQANERIVSLEKEKDLLQTTLEQERARLPAANAAERNDSVSSSPKPTSSSGPKRSGWKASRGRNARCNNGSKRWRARRRPPRNWNRCPGVGRGNAKAQ